MCVNSAQWMEHSRHSKSECPSVYRDKSLHVYGCLWPGGLHANRKLRNNDPLAESQPLGTRCSQIFSQRFSLAAQDVKSVILVSSHSCARSVNWRTERRKTNEGSQLVLHEGSPKTAVCPGISLGSGGLGGNLTAQASLEGFMGTALRPPSGTCWNKTVRSIHHTLLMSAHLQAPFFRHGGCEEPGELQCGREKGREDGF